MLAIARSRSIQIAARRGAALALGAFAVAATPSRHPAPSCAKDNAGLTLPDGFCAAVFAQDLGPARHLAVAPNGDVFANISDKNVAGMRDTTGDGVADLVRHFGKDGGTGIALTDGFLYYATDDAVYRYPWRAGQLEPTSPRETVVSGLPHGGDHNAKSIAIGPGDALYVNVGSATNSCQVANRQSHSPGKDPCTELETRAGIWRFSASKPGQTFGDGERFATGLRNTVALAIQPGTGALYGAMMGRDQLTQNWGVPAKKGAENPGEELVRIEKGDNFGWPYCYYDVDLHHLVLAPEYGGDGTRVGRCAEFKEPLIAFPGHWAPLAIAFSTPATARQFGSAYRDGLFIAFHGSWNRAPLPQAGYRVSWVPFRSGKPTGKYSTFAIGSAGPTWLRASGVAVGPDGALYVASDGKGMIWRIVNASAPPAEEARAGEGATRAPQ
ncbi:MAG TPA: PQQ-dependent sugar dehydrogenase [Gemmatimonadales bacterium]|nr:PQQ-dependent sugar dehydrogenase [Gemmatimonadales bacterium]